MDASSPPVARYLAVGASLLFTSAFVGPLYAIKRTRIGHENALDEHGQPYTRDHPTVIKARLSTTALSMPVCALGVWGLARYGGFFSAEASVWRQTADTLRLIGLRLPESLGYATRLVALPVVLTASLFIGPLYTGYLQSSLPGMKGFRWREARQRLCSWPGIRNWIHAPITEEFVFRACILAAGAMAKETRNQLIFLSPLYFGLAHVHHAYESYIGGGRTREALQRGVIQSAFQFSYTYLMGIYGAFLFLRTSSIVPPILAHAVANMFGFPQPQYALQEYPKQKPVIAAAYVTGILAFATGLTRLTRPALFGSSAASLYSYAFF